MTNGGKFWQFFRPVGAFFRVSLSLACRWPLVPPRNEVNPIADLEGLGKNSLLRIMERGALGVRIKSDFSLFFLSLLLYLYSLHISFTLF